MLCHQVDTPNICCRLARRRQDNQILLLTIAQWAEHGAAAHKYRVTRGVSGGTALASGAIGNIALAGVAPSDEPHRRDRGIHARGCWHDGPPLKLHFLPKLKRTAADFGQLSLSHLLSTLLLFRWCWLSQRRGQQLAPRWPWHSSPGPLPRRNCRPRADTSSWHGPLPR